MNEEITYEIVCFCRSTRASFCIKSCTQKYSLCWQKKKKSPRILHKLRPNDVQSRRFFVKMLTDSRNVLIYWRPPTVNNWTWTERKLEEWKAFWNNFLQHRRDRFLHYLFRNLNWGATENGDFFFFFWRGVAGWRSFPGRLFFFICRSTQVDAGAHPGGRFALILSPCWGVISWAGGGKQAGGRPPEKSACRLLGFFIQEANIFLSIIPWKLIWNRGGCVLY